VLSFSQGHDFPSRNRESDDFLSSAPKIRFLWLFHMKTNDTVGYSHLVQTMKLCVLSMPRPAVIKSVKRVIASDTGLSVPHAVAPPSDAMPDHVLFAVKYEGVNLTVLAQALP
jgi:hypothetical protein